MANATNLSEKQREALYRVRVARGVSSVHGNTINSLKRRGLIEDYGGELYTTPAGEVALGYEPVEVPAYIEELRTLQDDIVAAAEKQGFKDSWQASYAMPKEITLGDLRWTLYPRYRHELEALLRFLEA